MYLNPFINTLIIHTLRRKGAGTIMLRHLTSKKTSLVYL